MFYNEQCSFSDSGKIPSRKNRVENQAECTECTALASPRAQRLGRSLRTPSACPSARPTYALRPPERLPSACTPSPAPARRVAATVTVLQYSTALSQPQYNPLYCDTNCPQPSLLQYKPLYCNLAYTSLSHNTKYCIATQSYSLLSYCLQYNFNIATQNFFFFQYNWAIAHSRFCTRNILNFFFRFFNIYIYILFYFFSTISSSWKNHQKSLKSFFFHSL